jgi:endo-1,4-beta-xylanase
LAKEYFPASAQLIINDYNIPNSTSNTTQYLNIINLLLERDLIDGIGVQGHAFSTRGSMATVSSNLDRLAETGLPIIVTEMNIDGGSGTGVNAPTEQEQLNDYMRIFPTFWAHPGVVGISLSGWRTGMGNAEAILININGSERLAMQWLSTYVDTSKAGLISSVEGKESFPEKFHISNNYPNPFNPVTLINYYVAKTAHIKIDVYDITGKQVNSLVNDVQSPGRYTVIFNAEKLSSGIYFYRFKAGSFNRTKRMILIK